MIGLLLLLFDDYGAYTYAVADTVADAVLHPRVFCVVPSFVFIGTESVFGHRPRSCSVR